MSGHVKEVQLTAQEFLSLTGQGFLTAPLMQIVKAAQKRGGGYSISVSKQQAEEFRSAFTQRLAEGGFDTEYRVTEEGKLLEALIDRFFFDLSKRNLVGL